MFEAWKQRKKNRIEEESHYMNNMTKYSRISYIDEILLYRKNIPVPLMCQKRFLNIMDPKLNRISPVLYKSTGRSQNKISRPLFWSTTPSDRQKWFSLGEEACKQSEAARTASIGQPHRYLSGKQDTSSDLRDRNTVVLIGKQTEEPKFAGRGSWCY